MRKITAQAKNAFDLDRPFKSGNTKVTVSYKPNGYWYHTELWLHDNLIARKTHFEPTECIITSVTLAGWPTPTTRERLQAAGAIVRQEKGKQIIVNSVNGEREIDPEEWADIRYEDLMF